jgi:hypothetical protein
MDGSRPEFGIARPLGDDADDEVTIETNADCIVDTLIALEQGLGARAQPRDVLDKVQLQSERVIEELVRTYSCDVARGEVGAGGSANASAPTTSSLTCPTVLMYGRIQSGKTLAMIATSALAIDNGFRVIVVFTSNYVQLVEQTEERFSVLQGPLVRASTSRDMWDDDAEHIREHVAEHGVVIVCAKDPNHLRKLSDFLQKIDAGSYPALIFDDEADQATPDTNTRARSRARTGEEPAPSRIHDQIVTAEKSIRATLRSHVFVQVTATPFSLLLQHAESEMSPSSTLLLEPGDGYTGGEHFFSARHVEDEAPPLVYVDLEETEEIDSCPDEAPLGLARAVSFFLVSAATQYIEARKDAAAGQNFLCHTSHKKGEHEKLAKLIRGFLSTVADDLKGDAVRGSTSVRLEEARAELGRTVRTVPSLEQIASVLRKRLPRRHIYVVNSEQKRVKFGRHMNFLIGGNILGRGLTIDNLLVTYYLRYPKTSQMDTVLQHARMFGYRGALMQYSRVYLPELLATRFHRIHCTEAALRGQIESHPDWDRYPVQAAKGLRISRLSVLDPRYVETYGPGDHVFPTLRPYVERNDGPTTKRIAGAVERLTGEAWKALCRIKSPPDRFFRIELSDLCELVRTIPVNAQDVSAWDPVSLDVVLQSISAECGSRGFLYTRPMQRRKRGRDGRERRTFGTGAASGPEVSLARAQSGPVLFLFKEEGTYLDGQQFWYPSLVFPSWMSNTLVSSN